MSNINSFHDDAAIDRCRIVKKFKYVSKVSVKLLFEDNSIQIFKRIETKVSFKVQKLYC